MPIPGVHHHLHLVLCISPNTTSLASMRSSSLDCSSLFRCCTVVHVEAWSAESLQGLATSGCSICLDDDPKNSWENIGWWISKNPTQTFKMFLMMTNKHVDDINGDNTVETLWDFYSKHLIFITQKAIDLSVIRWGFHLSESSYHAAAAAQDADLLGGLDNQRDLSVIFRYFFDFKYDPTGKYWKTYGMVNSTHTQLKMASLGCRKWVSGEILEWCQVVSRMFFLFFLTSATSSENDASKLTGQGWQPQDWDWVAEIWCFSTRPGCLDGLDVAGASWRCWKATWICWRPRGNETTRSCLVHHPQIDIISINIIEDYVRNYHVPSSIGGNWSSSIFEKTHIPFLYSYSIVIVFPKYIQLEWL